MRCHDNFEWICLPLEKLLHVRIVLTVLYYYFNCGMCLQNFNPTQKLVKM